MEVSPLQSAPACHPCAGPNLSNYGGKPKNLLTDNGPEFAGTALDAWTYERKINHQFIQPGKPNQNAYVESFNGKVRDES